MLNTNTEFLKNELADVIRLFEGGDKAKIVHTFNYEDGKFINVVSVNGKEFHSADERAYVDALEFKRYAKRFAKSALYFALAEQLQQTMPWGALTGIRPTKLAYSFLETGELFVPFFEKFGVSRENIALITDIIDAQKGFYRKRAEGADLYVGIPFCPSKCTYCSFITADIAATKKFLPDYLRALEQEIAASVGLFDHLKSVYIGGGTPLALSECELERVLSAVAKVAPRGIEYTVEAGRPDVFTEEKLQLLQEFGVTRICVNPQSFNDKTLRAIGRRHTASDIYRAFEMSRKYNFIVNFDLIAGLTDETLSEFMFSVDEAVRLSPENITVHTLCLKKGAKLKESEERLIVRDIEEMIAYSRRALYGAGYIPYYLYRQKYMAGNCENTGWCRRGTECVYNIDVMEEIADNIACGANSVSKKIHSDQSRIERYGAPKDLKTYIEKIDTITAEKRRMFGR